MAVNVQRMAFDEARPALKRGPIGSGSCHGRLAETESNKRRKAVILRYVSVPLSVTCCFDASFTIHNLVSFSPLINPNLFAQLKAICKVDI